MAIVDVNIQVEIKSKGKKLEALTINQLTHLIGNTKQSVYSLINQLNKDNENYLDICFPFPNSKEDINSGPMFVLLNDKGRAYLKKNIKRKHKPKDTATSEDHQSIIEGMFDKHLCKKVHFSYRHTKMAKDLFKSFTEKEVTKAFVNISNSAHKKNTYSLINLDFILRKSEMSKWSNIKNK